MKLWDRRIRIKLKDFSTIELLDELKRRELTKDIDYSNSTESSVGSRVMITSCYCDGYDSEDYPYTEHIDRTGVIISILDRDKYNYKIKYDCCHKDCCWNENELEVIK